jgi:hypothetical protein
MLLLFAVITSSCKKEIRSAQAAEGDNSLQTNSLLNDKNSTCRLLTWQGLDDGYLRTLEYNDKGLLENWHELVPAYDVDQLTTYKYDHNKKVASVNYSDHGTLLNVIIPVYKFNHIVKELWYLADGITLDDQVVNTYDRRDRLVKRESMNYDYIATFIYDAVGNNINYSLRSKEGYLYDSLVQAFEKPVKEPMVAVPGLPYPIQYINYVICKQKYTRFKEVYDDGTGNIVTAFEIDPAQSDLRSGPDNYAVYYKSFDIVGQYSYRQVWYYENCGCNYRELQFSDNAIKASPLLPTVKNKAHSQFITINEMKERVRSRRAQLSGVIK